MESLKGRKPREFAVAFKEAAARRLLAGESGTALSRELAVKRGVLYRWLDSISAGSSSLPTHESSREGPYPVGPARQYSQLYSRYVGARQRCQRVG